MGRHSARGYEIVRIPHQKSYQGRVGGFWWDGWFLEVVSSGRASGGWVKFLLIKYECFLFPLPIKM